MSNLGALGVPTWQIPEGMQYALAQKQTKKVASNVGVVLNDDRQDKIREKVRIAPGNSASTLLSMLGFHLEGDVYPDFLEKNVLDIGGGFGGLAPVLSQSAYQITVVDPIFREEKLDDYYSVDLRKLEKKHQLVHHYSTSDVPHHIRLIREKNLAEMDNVYRETLWWKEYDPIGKHAHIKRNPSYGENLIGIQDGSQDFVFANYVLLKETVHPEEFLYEVLRVLKKGGGFIVSDYEMKNSVRESLYKVFDTYAADIVQDDSTRFIARFTKSR